ncbi:MAG: DUF3426 domain-containing protein [Thermodesulfobacteriota bacterium]
MIVECPNCKTTYNLDDSLIPEGGRKVKCTVCEHRFTVEPASKGAVHDQDIEDLFGDSGDFGESGSEFAAALDNLNEPEEAAAPKAPAAKGGYEIPEDLASASAEDLSGEAAPAKKGDGAGMSLDGGFSLEAKPKKEKAAGGRRKGLVIGIAAGALLLLAGAAAGLYFFKPGLIPGLGAKPAAEEAGAKPVDQAQVENITLDKIRQYYVDNEKAGRLFVVEGVAVNDFDAPKELIVVEVGLFDASGQMVASKRQLAGNVLSLYNLQILEWDKIESGLVNESGVAANNMFVQPKGEVPFMVAMANTPEAVSEFVIKVVEVKDPPPQK